MLGTAGLQIDVDEGLNDKSGGVDFGQQFGAMDQGLGLPNSKLTKPKSTWTRLNQMDFGLGEISKALKLCTLGKRTSKPDEGEGMEADSEIRVVKRGKGGQHDIDFDVISARVEFHPCR